MLVGWTTIPLAACGRLGNARADATSNRGSCAIAAEVASKSTAACGFITHYDATQPRRVEPQMAVIPLESRDCGIFRKPYVHYSHSSHNSEEGRGAVRHD